MDVPLPRGEAARAVTVLGRCMGDAFRIGDPPPPKEEAAALVRDMGEEGRPTAEADAAYCCCCVEADTKDVVARCGIGDDDDDDDEGSAAELLLLAMRDIGEDGRR